MPPRSALPLLRFLLLIWAGTQGPCFFEARAATYRYRMTWREDPATTAVIGFQQVGDSPVRLVYDLQPGGTDPANYRFSARPARTTNYHGMRNVFVHLGRLRPATTYHFLVIDADGSSRPLRFETAPASPASPLSIVAGGDSRNNRAVAQAANRLVAKLRPHFVLFGGDMTTSDSPAEWAAWLDDWQLTTSADGRLTPILPARGNHEASNATIYELFDVPSPAVTYALTFGGSLLRTYTLNSLNAPGGNQQAWLSRDLATCRTQWKIAQYHHSMRPHTARKRENDPLVFYWAGLFHHFGVDLVLESDGHVVKQTWPIRPSRQPGSAQGFVRDDAAGTVYIGEGGWGAPLRANDDDKPWTRASGSFNQFKWIWVSAADVQVRTVVIDRSDVRQEVADHDRFRTPPGLYYWEAANSGDVLRLPRRAPAGGGGGHAPGPRPTVTAASADAPPVLSRAADGTVSLRYTLAEAGPVTVLVVDDRMQMLHRQQLPPRGPGPYTETIRLPALPRGNLQLVVKGGSGVVAKFRLR